ncbi:MAG: PEP-CTERM/exosortase system-associated acyltransferase [Desulfocapsaceae bacterium]|nr:PEP-CTERM/exosortase system-associated acyltransferase [Desulfocapsaceae bacterium]
MSNTFETSPRHTIQDAFFTPGSLLLIRKRLTQEKTSEEHMALYNLRYRVYCHEARFLNPDDYPDNLERDEYDAVSEHFLASNARNKNEIIGTVRLVRWSERLSFPTVLHCPSLLKKLERQKFPLESTAEISRLCIARQYRSCAVDGLHGAKINTDNRDQWKRFSAVILELFKIMYLSSRYDLGITHWIATFEDSLYRMLERYGVYFELLAPEYIDYYGKVRIYGACIRRVEDEMRRRRPELAAFFER